MTSTGARAAALDGLPRDVGALAGHEMLPWDVWGAMTPDDATLDLPFLDQIARLSCQPDAAGGDLAAVLANPRVAVPDTVFNAVRNRAEPALPAT